MYTELSSMLQPPALYAKTEIPFWDDEHISGQMLKAHLDPDFEGASRKMQFIDRSAKWISEALPSSQYRQLLDIGCGPGIYGEKFAAGGYQVTGIDFSRRSIAYARKSAAKKGLGIRYLCQNYLQMDFNQTFDLATMIYCDYGALSAEDRSLIMNAAYRCLKPGGRFLLDVFTADHYRRFKPAQTWERCENGGFWSPKPYLAFTGSYQYPGCVTLEHICVVSGDGVSAYYLWNTCFTAETLAAEAAAAGFKVRGLYADVAGTAPGENDPTMAILLEK